MNLTFYFSLELDRYDNEGEYYYDLSSHLSSHTEYPDIEATIKISPTPKPGWKVNNVITPKDVKLYLVVCKADSSLF